MCSGYNRRAQTSSDGYRNATNHRADGDVPQHVCLAIPILVRIMDKGKHRRIERDDAPGRKVEYDHQRYEDEHARKYKESGCNEKLFEFTNFADRFFTRAYGQIFGMRSCKVSGIDE